MRTLSRLIALAFPERRIRARLSTVPTIVTVMGGRTEVTVRGLRWDVA